jgi:hypothetical protein
VFTVYDWLCGAFLSHPLPLQPLRRVWRLFWRLTRQRRNRGNSRCPTVFHPRLLRYGLYSVLPRSLVQFSNLFGCHHSYLLDYIQELRAKRLECPGIGAVFSERIQLLRCFLWVGSELIHRSDSQCRQLNMPSGVSKISPSVKSGGRSSGSKQS